MKKPKVSFETERLLIRTVEEFDKEKYMALRAETSEIATAYTAFPEFREFEWDNELNSLNSIYLAVFYKENSEFVASCSIQGFNTTIIEFGFDVVEEYRNQGIATELVKGLLQIVDDIFPGKPVIIRTKITNSACKKVAEKCGGKLDSFETNAIARALKELIRAFDSQKTVNDETLKTRKQNKELVDENTEDVCVYYLRC